ncbi:hypothetical protein [Clostridium sp. DL1XJH146]
MIVNKKYLEDLKEHLFLKISQETENKILEKFAKEPDANEYTEQDIYEQIRKMVRI